MRLIPAFWRLMSSFLAIDENDVVCIGGFIGKTPDGITTTYERGGSDRTAVDLGILFHKKYEVSIDFEKDKSKIAKIVVANHSFVIKIKLVFRFVLMRLFFLKSRRFLFVNP